jgi:hypothetical protein
MPASPQQRRAVHAPGIGLDRQRAGFHPDAEGQHLRGTALPARCLRQWKHRWLRVKDDRTATGCRELAEAAQQRSVGEDLVGVVHIRRAGQSQLLGQLLPRLRAHARRGAHPDAIPGPAPVAGMALGRPAGHVARNSSVGIEAARLRRQIDRLPLRIVEVGVGPLGIVADVELPRTVQRHNGLAQGDGRDRRGRRLRPRCRGTKTQQTKNRNRPVTHPAHATPPPKSPVTKHQQSSRQPSYGSKTKADLLRG